MSEVVIVAAYRSPIGNLNGSLSSLKAHELGAQVIRHLLAQFDKEQVRNVDELIIGQTLTAGQGQNPARQTLIHSGLPHSTTATSVNMLCGSGLKACVLGYQAIRSGDARMVLCGGQESMSQAPHLLFMREACKMGDRKLIDSMLHDGLTDAFENCLMGVTAEHVASKYGVSRREQDEFAYESQMKYKHAFLNNEFQSQIVPIRVRVGRNEEKLVLNDEFPRLDTTLEALQKLKSVFKLTSEGGCVTPGNSSGINDGAAMCLLMNSDEADKLNLSRPLARIVSWAQCGCEPILMGTSPIDSIRMALSKAKWSIDDVDLYEINEAFAAQSIVIQKQLNLNKDKPIGCSGTRVLVTLVHALFKRNLKKGLVALCIGGGMSISMCIECI